MRHLPAKELLAAGPIEAKAATLGCGRTEESLLERGK